MLLRGVDLNKIQLRETLSRIYFPCKINGQSYRVLFDPGSPNTVITVELAKSLGLQAVGSKAEIRISGSTVPVVPVIIPQISIGNMVISEVRVLAGLDAKIWRKTIILGLNVLNYFKYTVDRENDPGYIVLEMNGRAAPRSSDRRKFNHLLSNTGYYITDETTPV